MMRRPRALAFLGSLFLTPFAGIATAGTYDPAPAPAPAAPAVRATPSPPPVTVGAPVAPPARANDARTITELRAQVRDLQAKLYDERNRHRTSVRQVRTDQASREKAYRQELVQRVDVRHNLEIAGAVYGVPAARLRRIAWCESNHVPQAQNGRYLGLFQFGTWLWEQTPYGAFERTDPLAASLAGAWAFSRGYDKHWPICGKL